MKWTMLIVEANYMNLEHVQTNCGATKLTSVIEMSLIKEKLHVVCKYWYDVRCPFCMVVEEAFCCTVVL